MTLILRCEWPRHFLIRITIAFIGDQMDDLCRGDFMRALVVAACGQRDDKLEQRGSALVVGYAHPPAASLKVRL